MQPAFLIFVATMLGVCAYAILHGGRDERLGAILLAAAAVLSPLAIARDWAAPELGVTIVDVGLFAALLMLSLRSRAFWPMWAAGFQLCAVAVHVVAGVSPALLPAAYAETLALWAYPVLAALAVGTWAEAGGNHGRHH